MAGHLNDISSGLDPTIQGQAKSERLRVNPVANVSRDIEVPLTSITNYVNLLKREKIQDPKIATYPEVPDQKSQRLKTLAEDLVEASKASSGNMKLDISGVDLVELVWQTNGESEGWFVPCRLGLISSIPDEVFIIQTDGRRLWYVLKSLYANAVKYATEHSRAYVDVLDEGGRAILTIKNISESSLNIGPDELIRHFARGDVSRAVEGDDLGLSISKDLIRLQGSEFQVVIDRDLFKVAVSSPVKRVEFKAEKTTGESGDISQGSGYEEDIVV